MPEIAEVRVVANTLKKQILNAKIKKVQVLYSGIIDGNTTEFINEITNKTIKDIKTYGKWIMFNLGDKTLLSHLRMEGKYFYKDSNEPIVKHEHIIFSLDNGKDLRYADVRKFGKMQLVDTNKVFETECIKKLGLEPDDNNLTSEYLLKKLSKLNKPIKTSLLDQTIINGLGNIYANEVLFAAKIYPLTNSNKITKKQAQSIIDNASRIIKKSYELGGTTIKSYTSSLGVIGHYQDELMVQSRESKPCKICHTPIKRIKLDGRSIFYCEKCQRKNLI